MAAAPYRSPDATANAGDTQPGSAVPTGRAAKQDTAQPLPAPPAATARAASCGSGVSAPCLPPSPARPAAAGGVPCKGRTGVACAGRRGCPGTDSPVDQPAAASARRRLVGGGLLLRGTGGRSAGGSRAGLARPGARVGRVLALSVRISCSRCSIRVFSSISEALCSSRRPLTWELRLSSVGSPARLNASAAGDSRSRFVRFPRCRDALFFGEFLASGQLVPRVL